MSPASTSPQSPPETSPAAPAGTAASPSSPSSIPVDAALAGAVAGPDPLNPTATDLDILEFSDYDLIIDARSPREYEDDHLPGAVNLPVVGNDEFAQVGILYKADRHRAYLRGVADSLRNMADAIDARFSGMPANARLLVYCFRGGKRSRLWFDTLRTIGFRTDRVDGGWKRYRRWVIAVLERFPERFDYHVVNGPTGCGKTRLLHALAAAGEQVLDLEGLARHRGSLIGTIPGVSQPGQKLFESELLQVLRGFDPRRPVWVEAESKKIGDVQLPTSLHQGLHQARHRYLVQAPMAERVRVWREDFAHFASDPGAMLERLVYLVPLIGREIYEQWQALARAGEIDALFERVMVDHYDPAYGRTQRRNYGERVFIDLPLSDLGAAALADVARQLAAATGAHASISANTGASTSASADVASSRQPLHDGR